MKRRLFPQIALWLLASGFCSACQDEIIATPPSVTDGETVSVEVTFDTEDVQDACDLLPQQGAAATRTACPKGGAIKVELLPAAATRSIELEKPTELKNVYIVQKKADGTIVILNSGKPLTLSLGTKQTLTGLQVDGDSQLYILAANGATLNVTPSASNLADWAVTSASVNSVETDISKMPYYLHLKHVKITNDGIIQSLQGHDARLRLRRLAARININWQFQGDIAKYYTLREVTLQDTPLKYHAFPLDGKDTYPDLIDQYYTAKLYDAGSGNSSTNTASCWIARNVRGTANISNETMRSKDYAPQGSSYLLFVATRKDNPKQRLTYRIYLGGNSINDFNVQDNTNYTYSLTFTTDDNIANTDDRVQLLDGSAASVGNTTFVPTANCFMVKPGGSFHFDPFLFHRVEGGVEKDVENSVLKGWAASRGGICSVRVLWQTRENGDTGDPVLGVVNSSSDHTNIVELTGTDNKSLASVVTTGYTAPDQCHIHCRVAPGTIGGNGVIAAYDAKGEILWSWHLWVTDYAPSATGLDEYYGDPTKRKLRFTYNNSSVLPMMDRNLGAMMGYVGTPPTTYQDMSKANGLHYQWGRKDPFPSSYTTKSILRIDNKNATTPPEGMQNRYGPDGITYVVNESSMSLLSLEAISKTPIVFYAKKGHSDEWGGDTGVGPDWADGTAMNTATWDGAAKTFYDPSPAGWRVASRNDLNAIVTTKNNVANSSSQYQNGGYMVYYQANGSGNTNYFRFTGYGRFFSTFEFINTLCVVWSRTNGTATTTGSIWLGKQDTKVRYDFSTGSYKSDASSVRCIQERQ